MAEEKMRKIRRRTFDKSGQEYPTAARFALRPDQSFRAFPARSLLNWNIPMSSISDPPRNKKRPCRGKLRRRAQKYTVQYTSTSRRTQPSGPFRRGKKRKKLLV